MQISDNTTRRLPCRKQNGRQDKPPSVSVGASTITSMLPAEPLGIRSSWNLSLPVKESKYTHKRPVRSFCHADVSPRCSLLVWIWYHVNRKCKHGICLVCQGLRTHGVLRQELIRNETRFSLRATTVPSGRLNSQTAVTTELCSLSLRT